MKEKLRELFNGDMFAKELGIIITEAEEGSAAATLTVTDKMLNGAGVANGGVVFTLIDFALAAAANSVSNGLALTMNVNINYCKPSLLGDTITANAACLAQSGKSTSCNVIATDQNGDVVAVAHGTVYRKQE